MKLPLGFFAILGLIFAILSIRADAQSLPSSLSFTISGSFNNGVQESNNSVLIADNNLTDGYASGMDLTNAPATLNPTGPTGSAAFQWGTPSTSSSYPHSSAIWFEPLAVANVTANQYFNLGYLYYRNGTIKSNTGASAVDIALALNFSNPSGMSPINTSFTSDLVNSPNTSDPVASADTVSLRNRGSILNFNDASGNSYYLELSFKVDQNTLDGTLSTEDQFRVFEGNQGRAELLGRITTTPGVTGGATIPEPSSSLLAVIGVLALIRRKR